LQILLATKGCNTYPFEVNKNSVITCYYLTYANIVFIIYKRGKYPQPMQEVCMDIKRKNSISALLIVFFILFLSLQAFSAVYDAVISTPGVI
jgi:hypothetical protein